MVVPKHRRASHGQFLVVLSTHGPRRVGAHDRNDDDDDDDDDDDEQNNYDNNSDTMQ